MLFALMCAQAVIQFFNEQAATDHTTNHCQSCEENCRIPLSTWAVQLDKLEQFVSSTVRECQP